MGNVNEHTKKLIFEAMATAIEDAYQSTVFTYSSEDESYRKGFDDAVDQYDKQMCEYVEKLQKLIDGYGEGV